MDARLPLPSSWGMRIRSKVQLIPDTKSCSLHLPNLIPQLLYTCGTLYPNIAFLDLCHIITYPLLCPQNVM